MSILNDIDALIVSVPSHTGNAPTGAALPYVVSRPLIIDDAVLAINGAAIDWDFQFSLYCAAASVEASFNAAVMVMGDLQGKRVGGTTLSTSMGYVGALVEGHYESQVTVQLNQGGIS
ncbi:tail terminator [Microbacterium phage WilliamStrong]|nr:tail terminator [Microbacterium phage WilliamStrong]